jgi:TPR repeat protein
MNRFKHIRTLITALLLCLLVSPVMAGKTLNGFDATRQGDYSGALQYWRERAKAGDAQAQFNLALMYHGGLGVAADEATALRWYQKSARNGYPWAQEYLAIAYQEGWFGLKPDREKSRLWLKKLEERSSY